MNKLLCLLDVSSYVHAGHVNKYTFLEDTIPVGATEITQRTPTGGASLIFNTILDLIDKADIIACCDRNATIKKEMLPAYKSARTHSRSIEVDKLATEYILEQCGVKVVYAAGYEADDWIYSIVKEKYDQYDEIRIYTGDSDLYFLVDDKVSCYPSTSKSKLITRGNYETAIKKGYITKYNSCTAHKILFGDPGDGIPGMPRDIAEVIAKIIFKDELFKYLGEKKILDYYITLLSPSYAKYVDIVYPLQVPYEVGTLSTPDRQSIYNFGDAINNKNCRGKSSQGWSVDEHIKHLHAKGLYLETED